MSHCDYCVRLKDVEERIRRIEDELETANLERAFIVTLNLGHCTNQENELDQRTKPDSEPVWNAKENK